MLNCLSCHDRRTPISALHIVSLIFVVANMFGPTSYAAKTSADIGDSCSIKLPKDENWTPTEAWVWDRLCRGRRADLSEFDLVSSESEQKKADCDPTIADTWPASRRIGDNFFLTILFDSPYSEIVARQGLSLHCARIDSGIENYIEENFESSISITDSYIEGDFGFENVHIEGDIRLDRSIINGTVSINHIQDIDSVWINETQINGDLTAEGIFIAHKFTLTESQVNWLKLSDASLGDIWISGAQINDDLSLQNSKGIESVWISKTQIYGDLSAEGISVAQEFTLTESQVNSLQLSDARLGDISISETKINEDLSAWSISVADDFRLKKSLVNSIDLSGSIMGDIRITETQINGDADLMDVKGIKSIWIDKAVITGDLYAGGISVAQDFRLKMSQVNLIDLSGVSMEDILISEAHINGGVDLENAKVGRFVTIQDTNIADVLSAKNIIMDEDFTLSGGEAAFVDLSEARVGGNVELSEIILERGFQGERIIIQDDLSIEGVTGNKMNTPLIDFSDMKAWEDGDGAGLFLSGGVVHGSLNLKTVSLAVLILKDMVIDQSFNMESSDINAVLFMSATIRNMTTMDNNNLDVFAALGGHFSHLLVGGLCTNSISLASTEVQGNLIIESSTVLGDVSFIMSEFGGNVVLRSVINGDLRFSAVSIDNNLFLEREFLQDIKLDLTHVDGSVLLAKGRFLGRVDLRGIEVGRELVLASTNHELPDWEDGGELSLRDAQVGDLRHVAASWQDLGGRYGITGLQYERLIFEDGDVPGQEPVWVLSWLKDQKDRGTYFNPQPYEELANALLRSGFNSLANDVSITARDHELNSREVGLSRKINLFLQKYIIGYGYQSWRAFGWLALLIAVGTYVSGKTCWGRRVGYMRRLFFSLDMLLPQLAQLDKRHDDLKLGGSFIWCPELPVGIGKEHKVVGPLTMPVQYYFFLHKLVGSILMLFAIAGLSGLTK